MSAQLPAQAGRSGAATGKAEWLANCLCLAASPCFAVMALVSTIGADADPICSASHAAFHLGGMAAMYWMMCAFHLPAWLRKRLVLTTLR
jgi:hypothetical protein